MNIQVRLCQLLLSKVFSYHWLPDKHFFTLLLQQSWSRIPPPPPVVKPNSFFLLCWCLFLHPGPTLPFWARITYLSPPLLLQPGKRKSHFAEFTTPKIHRLRPPSPLTRMISWKKKFSSQPRALFSWLGTPRGGVLTSPLQFWTTFIASLVRNVSESLQQSFV